MGGPYERLPERKDEILASGARPRIVLKERSGEHEVEIVGNRKGLLALAAICSGLAELSPEQLLTPANHEYFWGTEKGSIPLVVLRSEKEWSESK
jgi:hypothetical protein